jgi:hypothetical protein
VALDVQSATAGRLDSYVSVGLGIVGITLGLTP